MKCAATIEASESVKMKPSSLCLSAAVKLFRVSDVVALEDVRAMTALTSVA